MKNQIIKIHPFSEFWPTKSLRLRCAFQRTIVVIASVFTRISPNASQENFENVRKWFRFKNGGPKFGILPL